MEAYNAIDHELRRLTGLPEARPFSDALREAVKRRAVVRHHAEELRRLGDLRNAIVHWRDANRLIADPHADVVASIEAIRDELLNPPTAWDRFKRNSPVRLFDSSAALAGVLSAIHDFRFSQFPIYDGGSTFRGLLTEGTVTRWLAEQRDVGLADIDSATVGHVLEIGGSGEYVFVGRNTTLRDLEECFRVPRATPLQAALITEAGQQNAKPLAIVTAWDLVNKAS